MYCVLVFLASCVISLNISSLDFFERVITHDFIVVLTNTFQSTAQLSAHLLPIAYFITIQTNASYYGSSNKYVLTFCLISL